MRKGPSGIWLHGSDFISRYLDLLFWYRYIIGMKDNQIVTINSFFFHEGILMATLQLQFPLSKDKENQDF